MVRWFGASWGAPVCREDAASETPVGSACALCQKAVEKEGRGLLIPFIGGDQAEARPWVVYVDCERGFVRPSQPGVGPWPFLRGEPGEKPIALRRHVVYHLDCFMKHTCGPLYGNMAPHRPGLDRLLSDSDEDES